VLNHAMVEQASDRRDRVQNIQSMSKVSGTKCQRRSRIVLKDPENMRVSSEALAGQPSYGHEHAMAVSLQRTWASRNI
jgi:hypothetical protein